MVPTCIQDSMIKTGLASAVSGDMENSINEEKSAVKKLIEANKRLLGLDPNKDYLGIETNNQAPPRQYLQEEVQHKPIERKLNSNEGIQTDRVGKLEEKVNSMETMLSKILLAVQK